MKHFIILYNGIWVALCVKVNKGTEQSKSREFDSHVSRRSVCMLYAADARKILFMVTKSSQLKLAG